MKFSRKSALSLALLVALTPALALAASDNATLTINATVAARAKLTISPTTINFPDADPDVTASIPANENAVTVSAKIRTSAAGNATLTCLANGDLTSGSNTIAINNVSWTATGSGFSNGTMNASTAQSVGTWTGSGNRSGTFSFFLANSWAYTVGSYAQTATYTLSAP